MKDIAYGTKQVRVGSNQDYLTEMELKSHDAKGGKRKESFSFVGPPSVDHLDQQLIVNLERGQNIFEIHLSKVTFICK